MNPVLSALLCKHSTCSPEQVECLHSNDEMHGFMTVPTRKDKDYLEVTGTWSGFSIIAQKQHASELEAILTQRGFPCRREEDVQPDMDAIRFDEKTERTKVEEILEAFKQEKGS